MALSVIYPLLLRYRVAIGVRGELRLGSAGTKVLIGQERSYCERGGSDDEESSDRLRPSKWNL